MGDNRRALLGIEEEIKGCKLMVLKLGRKNTPSSYMYTTLPPRTCTPPSLLVHVHHPPSSYMYTTLPPCTCNTTLTPCILTTLGAASPVQYCQHTHTHTHTHRHTHTHTHIYTQTHTHTTQGHSQRDHTTLQTLSQCTTTSSFGRAYYIPALLNCTLEDHRCTINIWWVWHQIASNNYAVINVGVCASTGNAAPN